MKKRFISIIACLMLALMLVGCGAERTIESYYSNPVMKAAYDKVMEQQLDAYKAIYSNYDYTVKGNTMTHIYTYREAIDPSVVESFKAETDKTLSSSVPNEIASTKKSIGIADDTPVTLTFIYKNPDGSEIASFSYTN